MRYRLLGPTGRSVPILGQGTWQLERDSRAHSIAALRRGLDLGLTHIDTADLYGNGEVETIVGQAIASRRGEVFLVSKVAPDHASRRGTLEACERSLRRLATDHLDLYLLHWPGHHPLADTLAAFDDLVRAGKVLAWGLSNFDEHQLATALAIAGEGQVACNQVLYNLEDRTIEHAVVPYCAEHRIAVVAYAPFGSGRFPRRSTRRGRVLAEIAEDHHVTPHQVALAFLLRHPSLFSIPKASHPDHLQENAAAAELILSPDELTRIEYVFPHHHPQAGLPGQG